MDYREMARLANDPGAVRAIAAGLKAILGSRLSEWEREFLQKLERFEGPEALSVRQRETLYSLRERSSRKAVVKGFRASHLIERLWEQRLDLSEEAEDFIGEMRKAGPDLSLSPRQWRYVFSLCHQTGDIEQYVSLG